MRSALRCAVLAALLPALNSGAPAGFQTLSPSATLRFPASASVSGALEGDFTLAIWLWADPGAQSDRSIVSIPGALDLLVSPDGALRAALSSESAVPLEAAIPAAMDDGGWRLICVSFDRGAGALRLEVLDEAHGARAAESIAPGFDPAPAQSGPILGATDDSPAFEGTYALVALRSEAMGPQDAAAVWSAARLHGPYDLVPVSAGARMSGEAGCVWMIGQAMTTKPSDGLSTGSSTGQRAALVGEPVTTLNVEVYDVGAGESPLSLRTVRPVLGVQDMRFVSPHDPPHASFFVRRTPSLDPPLPEDPTVSAVAPMIRRLVDGPDRLIRVMTSANSRAIQRNDGSGVSPGNYAHGFIDLWPDRLAGVLLRPATLNRHPWAGFDASENPPFRSGVVDSIEPTGLSRFWTGSASANGVGPGSGLLMAPGSAYVIRSKPQGLMRADAPLGVSTHLLAFPGASDALLTRNRWRRQGGAGLSEGETLRIPLDTSRLEAQLGAIDPTRRTLSLLGAEGWEIEPGDACAIGADVGVVIGVEAADGGATVTLAHPLDAQPAVGSTVRIGAWRIESVTLDFAPVAPGDPDDWRGVRLEADAAGGAGVCVFAFDAVRPDAAGFAIGAAGWGGNGYDVQIDRSNPGAMEAWMRASGADVWLQMYAQQESAAASMDSITSLVRDAVPDAQVAWLGDMMHEVAFEPWQRHTLDNAGGAGVPAVVLLQHPRIGDDLEQWGDGLKANSAHSNGRGNLRLAELWAGELARVALPGPSGDATLDGAVDFADLNLVLSSYGVAASPHPADLNGDGVVGFTDLHLVLAGFGAGF